MKPCSYCGRQNDPATQACLECGQSLEREPPRSGIPAPVLRLLGVALRVIKRLLLLTLAWFSFTQLIAWGCAPATPKTDYTGDWRYTQPHHVRVIERPLPPAAQVWSNYSAWKGTNPEIAAALSRIYSVKLSGAHRQKNLKVDHGYTKNMPVGDYAYTSISFDYHDETNGVYHFTWWKRGRHRPDFLKLTDTQKTFQVIVHGGQPPDTKLSIVAIEDVTPF